MSRPRTPSAKAETEGRTIINPGRHKGRAKPRVRPLGSPYAWMTERERKCWELFAEEMPWLAASDRRLLSVACRLSARMEESEDFGVNALGQLRMCLAAMGGTPSDVSRIYAPAEDGEADPAAEFVN